MATGSVRDKKRRGRRRSAVLTVSDVQRLFEKSAANTGVHVEFQQITCSLNPYFLLIPISKIKI